MLPRDNHINNPGVQTPFVDTVSRLSLPLEDWERGGIDVADITQGSLVQLWHLVVDSAGTFTATAEDGKVRTLLMRPGTSQAGLAWDQQMQPVLVWRDGSGAHLRYYVNAQEGFRQIELPEDARQLRVTLDEKRTDFRLNSDVLVCYMRDTNLCMLVQRENYETEHILATELSGSLVAMGITTAYRMQWRIIQ